MKISAILSSNAPIKQSSVSSRLKEVMHIKNLRQVDILNAAKPFCSQYGVKLEKNDLSQYVSGKVEPKQEKLTVLSLALGVSDLWLMGYAVPMEKASHIFGDEENPFILEVSDALDTMPVDTQIPFAHFAQVCATNPYRAKEFLDQLPLDKGNGELPSRIIPVASNIHPMPQMKEWTVLGGTACGDPLYKELDGEKILAPADIDADFVFRCVGDSMINARIFDGDVVFVKSCSVEDGQIAVVRIGEEYTLKRVFRGPDYLELRSENPMYPVRIIRGEQENAEIVGRAVYFLSQVR